MARILIVDDEERDLKLLATRLAGLGHEVETARDGLEALAKVELDLDAVLLDVMMPGLDGYEVTRRIRQRFDRSRLPVIVVTSLGEREERLRAVEAGANDFLAKPVEATELKVRLQAALELKAATDALAPHRASLEDTVERRTAALRQALEGTVQAQRELYASQLETVHRLSVAAEYKDEDTAAHLERIGCYCELLARALELAPGEKEVLRVAAPMHDVGRIGVPERILLKPGPLDTEEWVIMRQHPIMGARILGGSSSRFLKAAEVIAMTHHEKWDGSGYPAGLAGEAIPLYGRICAVADVFDALTSRRPYKPPFPMEKALAILQEGRGAHFDPGMVDLFLGRLDDVLAVRRRLCDWEEAS